MKLSCSGPKMALNGYPGGKFYYPCPWKMLLPIGTQVPVSNTNANCLWSKFTEFSCRVIFLFCSKCTCIGFTRKSKFYQVLAGCSSVSVCGWRAELIRKWSILINRYYWQSTKSSHGISLMKSLEVANNIPYRFGICNSTFPNFRFICTGLQNNRPNK